MGMNWVKVRHPVANPVVPIVPASILKRLMQLAEDKVEKTGYIAFKSPKVSLRTVRKGDESSVTRSYLPFHFVTFHTHPVTEEQTLRIDEMTRRHGVIPSTADLRVLFSIMEVARRPHVELIASKYAVAAIYVDVPEEEAYNHMMHHKHKLKNYDEDFKDFMSYVIRYAVKSSPGCTISPEKRREHYDRLNLFTTKALHEMKVGFRILDTDKDFDVRTIINKYKWPKFEKNPKLWHTRPLMVTDDKFATQQQLLRHEFLGKMLPFMLRVTRGYPIVPESFSKRTGRFPFRRKWDGHTVILRTEKDIKDWMNRTGRFTKAGTMGYTKGLVTLYSELNPTDPIRIGIIDLDVKSKKVPERIPPSQRNQIMRVVKQLWRKKYLVFLMWTGRSWMIWFRRRDGKNLGQYQQVKEYIKKIGTNAGIFISKHVKRGHIFPHKLALDYATSSRRRPIRIPFSIHMGTGLVAIPVLPSRVCLKRFRPRVDSHPITVLRKQVTYKQMIVEFLQPERMNPVNLMSLFTFGLAEPKKIVLCPRCGLPKFFDNKRKVFYCPKC